MPAAPAACSNAPAQRSHHSTTVIETPSNRNGNVVTDHVKTPHAAISCTAGELVPGDVLLEDPVRLFVVMDAAPADQDNVQLTLRARHGGPDFFAWRLRVGVLRVLADRVDPATVPLIHPTPPTADFADQDRITVSYAAMPEPDEVTYERRRGGWYTLPDTGRTLTDQRMRDLMTSDPRTTVCRLQRSPGPAPHRRRVVVTGIGAVTPLGADAASTWHGLLSGATGSRELDGEEFGDLPIRIAAPATADPAEHFPRAQARTMNRCAQFAVLAAREAWADAGLPAPVRDSGQDTARGPERGTLLPERVGVSVGTIIGGAPVLVEADRTLRAKGPRYVSPHTTPMIVPSSAAAHIAIDRDARGEARTVVSACASGTEAIGQGIDRIREGRLDIVVAGGAEAVITPAIMAAFACMRAISPGPDGAGRAAKPFDRDRDGFVLGEGAGFLILEEEEHARARGAVVYCEAAGWGVSSDAHHMTAPRPDAAGITDALHKALADAEARPGEVVHVNAHATATPQGDTAEALALRTLFGDHTVPVTAPKGALGHLQGGAGGVEAVATVLSLHHRLIPPTAGLTTPEDGLGLDIVTRTPRPLPEDGDIALSNSFGFGGHNAVLAFRHTGQAPHPA